MFFLTVQVHRTFQLTPSRRATRIADYNDLLSGISTHALTEGDKSLSGTYITTDISTHALTEGDGKFRQIFLLNRGYAYSISLYFLPHFISLLPKFYLFSKNPLNFKCESSCFFLCTWHSHYRISVSITSNPAFAPTCSTLFLYFSPK